MSLVTPPDIPTARRAIVLVLCVAAIIGVTTYANRLAGNGSALEQGPPAASILSLDIQGKMRVYGSLVPGLPAGAQAAPFGAPGSFDQAQRTSPSLAVRLAALDLLNDDPDGALRTLDAVDSDPTLSTVAAGLAADPGSPAAALAAEESSRLRPLWARRAFRLHLLDGAGDSEALAREEGLVASEAVESLIGLIVVGAAMMVVLPLGVLLWLVGVPVLVIWRLSRIEQPSAADVPYMEPAAPVPPAPAAPPAPSLLTAGEVLVAFFGAQVLAGLLYRALQPEPGLSPYALLAIYAVATLAAWAVARWRIGPLVLSRAGFRYCAPWKLYVYPVLAALALPPIYIALALALAKLLGEPPQSSNPALTLMAGQEGWLGRIAMLVTVAVAAPLAEEGMFRGVLYSAIRGRMGAAGAIVASSVLFGLVHLDPLVAPMLILVGVATAILRELTGSLWPPTILHAIGNGGVALMVFMLMA